MSTGIQSRRTRRERSSPAGVEDPQLPLWGNQMPPQQPITSPEPPEHHTRAHSSPKKVAQQVGREILEGNFNPAEWASALAETGASDGRAVAEYARRRMEHLHPQHIHSQRKELEMEMRKRHSCGAVSNHSRRKRIRREQPSIPGLFLIFLGSWGLCASFHARVLSMDGTSLCVSSCLTATALLAIFVGGYFLSGKRVQRWFEGVKTLGIGSLLCGASLLIAVSLSFRPNPSSSTTGSSRLAPQKSSPDLEMSVPRATTPPPISRR